MGKLRSNLLQAQHRYIDIYEEETKNKVPKFSPALLTFCASSIQRNLASYKKHIGFGPIFPRG